MARWCLGSAGDILHHEQDAEDAFQATFFVLARKAGSRRWQESVGSWLYEVASRVARKARADRARRQIRERQMETMPSVDPLSMAAGNEIQAMLEEELCRLPEKYRLPVVLCCLEGSSRSEAAQQLGWKEGTVAGRLARGRSLLQRRLVRRGVTIPAAVLATLLTENLATAVVPAALTVTTIKAASLVAAGQPTAAGLISAPAVALAKEVLRAMFFTKLQMAVMVLAVAAAATGTGLMAHRALGGKAGDKEQLEGSPRAAQGVGNAKLDPPQQLRTDLYGDALPLGAIARLGIVRLRREDSSPSDLAFTTDGRFLVSARTDQVVQFWDVKTGKPLQELRQETKFERFALSPNTKVLATAGPEGIWSGMSTTESNCARLKQATSLPLLSPRMAKQWPLWGMTQSSGCGICPRDRRKPA